MLVRTKRGSVEFDGSSVTLRPPRGLGGIIGGKSAMSVPLRAIRYIEFSEPAGMKSGYFRVNTGQPPLSGTAMRPAFMEAVSDPHSIVFTRGEAPSFAELRNAIEAALGR
ncbi:hypothetical protein BLA60_33325 [Actinophytocola xinjiangensis]|uniref:DUF4429 domain-containing protein n=1 Tax=Actinophytocola xinjiangensis TaxID=485602 RepID=A0A7Z1AWA1_9PSEU|nr:DUF4429 domain-containing protein [Actinophytocola xinjiangensis]OLF06212.1 hypothetical protein BLA60_33325 [Actinophytocola xinjiangensis]